MIREFLISKALRQSNPTHRHICRAFYSLKYKPLNELKKEIRILEVLPWDHPARIASNLLQCRIKHACLNEEPHYHALSYSWGDKTPRYSILVNEEKVIIPENLHVALEHLCPLEGQVFTVWIDAICINQANDSEKSSQVQMMRDIFTQSQIVFAWLGPRSDDSDNAIAKLETIATDALHYDILRIDPSESASKYERFIESSNAINEGEHQRDFAAMQALFNREFFRQLWILQELTVPGQIIVICGRRQIRWPTLYTAVEALVLLQRFAQAAQIIAPKDTGHRQKLIFLDSLRSFTFKPSLLISIMALVDSPPFVQGDVNVDGSPLIQLDIPKQSLLTILETVTRSPDNTGFLQASDARDRIFALFGLAKDTTELKLQVDYGTSVPQLYTDIARKLLTQGSFELLSLCQSHEDEIDLPSWVPNWAAPTTRPIQIRGPRSRAFAAGGTEKGKVEFSSVASKPAIVLQGVRVCSVSKTGITVLRPSQSTNDLDPEEVRRWYDELEELGSTPSQHSKIMTSPEAEDSETWRLPIADQEFDYYAMLYSKSEPLYRKAGYPSYLAHQYRVLGRMLQADVGDRDRLLFNKAVTWFDWRMRTATAFRRTFKTIEGHLGLGPQDLKPDDILCIFLGASVPFVVRPVSNGLYRLVGDAYVLGIMDGEVMKHDPLIETFTVV